MEAVRVLQQTLMITAFVAVIMLVVEYLNVLTRGVLLGALQGSRWRQYVLAAILGAIPGCLGAYAAVALYAHRKVTLGALVAAMIATSGDEMFVMLALFPGTALVMTLGLAVLGVLAAWATDRLMPARLRTATETCCTLETHDLETCRCFARGEILAQWRPPSAYRGTLVLGLALVALAILTSQLGPAEWGWKRITLLLVIATGLFVSTTVPDHFLEEHLWRHVVLDHVPRVFLWTLAVLGGLAVLMHFVDLTSAVATHPWPVLGIASLVGLIPESGPHLAFVTMFSQGLIPLSVLVASSAVQDGHGMLPLLAASKRAFIVVKLINLVVGVMAGAVLLLAGL
jgi:hypothetical protein